jgi:hypothetical protein
MMAWRRAVY